MPAERAWRVSGSANRRSSDGMGIAAGVMLARPCDAAQIMADWDGDGRLDSVQPVDGGLELKLAYGLPRFISVVPPPTSIRAGDIDCNGALDLILDDGKRWILNRDLFTQPRGLPWRFRRQR